MFHEKNVGVFPSDPARLEAGPALSPGESHWLGEEPGFTVRRPRLAGSRNRSVKHVVSVSYLSQLCVIGEGGCASVTVEYEVEETQDLGRTYIYGNTLCHEKAALQPVKQYKITGVRSYNTIETAQNIRDASKTVLWQAENRNVKLSGNTFRL